MKRTYRTILSAVTLVLSLAGASAQAADFGVGVNLGTTGLGVAGSVDVNDFLGVRLGHSGFSTSGDFDEDGISYAVKVDVSMTDLFLDWRPWAGAFRVSLGYVANGTDVNGTATITQPVDFGGVVITDGAATSELVFDKSAYYLGVGWGTPVASEKGFGFTADMGVIALGEPDFNITSVNANSTVGNVPITQAQIDQEEANVQAELEDYLYPVLRFGIVYSF